MDLIITIVLIVGFVCYQYRQYKITKNALTDYRNLFPSKDEFQIMQEEQFPVIIANSSHTCYGELVRETNHYIKENRNTFELNTLKEIVNRRVLQEYEIASAKINTPMSLGLMGTYIGVIIGLIWMGITGFLKSGEEGFITEQSIISFMLGIGFALISSLTGLWMTTHNNHLAAEIDDEVQKDKSDFFYFLQTEVIGKIPTTVQETLSQLNGTISSLNSEFRTVIGDLKETFGSLSKDFGDSLSGNLNRIDSTVNLLGNNIESIGEIFNQQKDIIDKMLTAEYTTVLKKVAATVTVCEKVSDTVDELEVKTNASVQHQKEIIQLQQNTLSLHQEALTLQEKAVSLQTSQSEAYKEFADQLKTANKEFILSFGEIQKEIGDTYSGIHADFAEAVFQTQLKFNDNMKVPEEIFKSITSILDRFKGFEESLDAFGKAQVDQNTGMLKLIREQIERLTNVNTTIITYLDEFEKNGDGYLAGIHKEIEKKGDKFVRSWQDKFSIMDANGAPNPLGYLQRIDDLTHKTEEFAAQWLKETEKNNQTLIDLLKKIAEKQTKTHPPVSPHPLVNPPEPTGKKKKKSFWARVNVFGNK